ncbi:MAG: DUF1858 domain-containing protein [Chloroflexota bacterium]|nr:DUF1858 domain-containing protein [Chloroflexota bacterium]
MDDAITRDTRLSHLFRAYPALIEVMIDQSPHFERLRNPLLRRALTPLTTVGQAAGIAGLDVDELVAVLCQAADQPAPNASFKSAEDGKPTVSAAPAWLDAPVATLLDVRE